MNGEKRYSLDTNALVAFGNGEKKIGALLAGANAKIKLPDAIVMASASITRSILLTRDHQLLNSDFCETLEF